MENETNQIENIKKEIDDIILKRSEFLISKKFSKYSLEISKIYSQFNINKSKRIDALGAPQIDVNNLDQVIILTLKEANLFLLELSSPKDIFISFFLITSQKENEMEGIIKLIKQEIISKSLTEKYNNIFYEEKIKPMFIRYRNDNKIYNGKLDDDEVIHIVNIAEYNAKGIKIKTMNEVFKENENNIKKFKINYETTSLNSTNKKTKYKTKTKLKKNSNKMRASFFNDLNPNTLFIETLPQILIDYLKENQNLAFVEINEELTEELKIYNKDLLYKIKQYDELYSKNKKIENDMKKEREELNQYSSQLKNIQKNINLYAQIIIDKKKRSENTIFLEDMLNKLKAKENAIINDMNEVNRTPFVLNIQEKFNKFPHNNSQNKLKEYFSPNKIIDNNIVIQKIKIKEVPKLSFNDEKLNSQNLQSHNSDIKKYILPRSTSDIYKFSKFSKFKIVEKANSTNRYRNNNTNINNENSNSHNNTNNYNKQSLSTKDSIFTTISNMEKDNQFFGSKTKMKTTVSIELSPDLIESSLNEIFSFYSKSISNGLENDNKNFIFFDSFKKFCNDFKILISDSKIELFFYETLFDSNDNDNNNNNSEIDTNNKMNLNEFKIALNKISLEMSEIKKQKLKKTISDKKNLLNYIELREYLRQEEEKNHNKFTEKITGGIPKKNLEQNQFEFLSKYKKLKSEIIQFEYEYKKETQKNEQKIMKDFYNFLGIGNKSYKNKIKIKTNIFVENALKKYGHMNIFKNYQNINNIKSNTGYINHFNFNNNSQTINASQKNLFEKKLLRRLKFLNNYKNNISSNESTLKKEKNKFLENNINMSNDRYNLKNIEDLEDINSNGLNTKNTKNMNKNFSSFDFKIKGFENMNLNILPSINGLNGLNTGLNNNHNNIRYNLINSNSFLGNVNNI